VRARLFGDEAGRSGVRAVLQSLAVQVVEATFETEAAHEVGVDAEMIVFGDDLAASLACVEWRAGRSPRPAILALVADRSSVLIRRVLHAGANEVLFLPLDPGEAECALLKLAERRHQEQARDSGGCLICSVTSLSGGVGVTTVSANLALAMHYAFGRRVALADLDLQSGAMAFVLHLEPEQTIVALVEIAHKLDSIKLEAALTRHPSGIYLLAGPKRIEECDSVTDIALGAVLGLMRQMFDVVVIDCGQRVDENTIAAWEISDELLYVIEPSLASARTAGRFMRLFPELRLGNLTPRLVLNRWTEQPAVPLERLEHAMGAPLFATIPRDVHTAERLELRSDDLWQIAPHSPLARSMERLARLLATDGQSEVEPTRGLLARALNMFGLGA
jgi:pilus assembly protein CpaE